MIPNPKMTCDEHGCPATQEVVTPTTASNKLLISVARDSGWFVASESGPHKCPNHHPSNSVKAYTIAPGDLVWTYRGWREVLSIEATVSLEGPGEVSWSDFDQVFYTHDPDDLVFIKQY